MSTSAIVILSLMLTANIAIASPELDKDLADVHWPHEDQAVSDTAVGKISANLVLEQNETLSADSDNIEMLNNDALAEWRGL